MCEDWFNCDSVNSYFNVLAHLGFPNTFKFILYFTLWQATHAGLLLGELSLLWAPRYRKSLLIDHFKGLTIPCACGNTLVCVGIKGLNFGGPGLVVNDRFFSRVLPAAPGFQSESPVLIFKANGHDIVYDNAEEEWCLPAWCITPESMSHEEGFCKPILHESFGDGSHFGLPSYRFCIKSMMISGAQWRVWFYLGSSCLMFWWL